MKNVFILFALFLRIHALFSQECYPDPNGYFQYYVNLNIDKVENSFNKDALIKFLSKSTAVSAKLAADINKKIDKVEKAFPSSKTPFLQKSVTVFSKDSTLIRSFNLYKDLIKLAEKKCFPKEGLLYEPNDYYRNGSPLTHLALVKADKAFDISVGDLRVLIGMTDTYIEPTHEDLQYKISQILQNSSPHFHGTCAAGCAAAHTDNGLGITSTGSKCKIVFSSNWGNDNEVLNLAQINGVRVISLSWINSCGFNTQQSILYHEILTVHNVVVLAGAGNNCNHCGCNSYVYPASYEDVISVTSVGHIADIGYVDPNYGANNWKDCHDEVISTHQSHHHNDKVDICAPGYNVYTTFNGNTYGGQWGTSFSTPMVAGVCALVASANPCLTAQQIKDIVLNTADPNIYMLDCNIGYTGQLGNGRVDAYQAVKRAIEAGTVYVQNKAYSSALSTESAQTDIISGYNVTSQQPFGLVTINPNAKVVFEATHGITLGEGFQVLGNAEFEAKIIDSTCF